MSRPGHCKGVVVSATSVALLLEVMVFGAFAGEPEKRTVAAERGRPTIEISSRTDDAGRPVLKVVIDGIPRKKLDPERVQALIDLFRDGEGQGDDDDRPAARQDGARGGRDESEEEEDGDDDECEEEDEEDEDECEDDEDDDEEEEDDDDDERPARGNRREFEMELRLHIRRDIEEPCEAVKEAKPAAVKPAARPGREEKPIKKNPKNPKKPQPPAEQKKNGGVKAAAAETREVTDRGPAESRDAEWQSLVPLLRQQADQFRRVVGLQQAKAQESARRGVGD